MNKKKTYEGMFLVDAGNSDFEAASEPIRAVLGRSESEILSIKPWDERRLAYGIKGRRRALYVLTYFEADPARIAEIEHDCRLSEKILRMLILLRRQLSRDQIEAHTPATAKAAEAGKAKQARQEEPAETPAGQDDGADRAKAAAAGGPAEQAEAAPRETSGPAESEPKPSEDQPPAGPDEERKEPT
jgi:small subunit ribosomal protein S6